MKFSAIPKWKTPELNWHTMLPTIHQHFLCPWSILLNELLRHLYTDNPECFCQITSQMLVNPTPLLRQRNTTNHYKIDVKMIGNVGVVCEHARSHWHWQAPRSICKDLRPLIVSLLPASARSVRKEKKRVIVVSRSIGWNMSVPTSNIIHHPHRYQSFCIKKMETKEIWKIKSSNTWIGPHISSIDPRLTENSNPAYEIDVCNLPKKNQTQKL